MHADQSSGSGLDLSSSGTFAIPPTPMQVALDYAVRGFCVFPCVPGTKFPLKGSSGLTDASRDADRITAWWNEHPEANVAIATGPQSGLFVVDLDVKEGRNGIEVWTELVRQQGGDFGAPLVVKTPSGGLHLYYAYQPGLRTTAGRLGRGLCGTDPSKPSGIDTRGEGGYVLAPPSSIGGEAYRILAPAELTASPAWLVPLCQRTGRVVMPVEAHAGVVRHRLTRADLEVFADRTRKPELAYAARAVLAGQPWAAPGERYVRLRDLLASVWQFVHGEHGGAWLSSDTGELFAATCAAVNAQGVQQAVSPGSIACMIAEVEGKAAAYAQELAAERAQLEAEADEFLAAALARGRELAAANDNTPERTGPVATSGDGEPWIVCASSKYFLRRSSDGDYSGPYSSSEHVVQKLVELAPQLKRDLVDVAEHNGADELVYRSTQRAMTNFGVQAEGLSYSNYAARSGLTDGSFVLRVARLRPVQSERNRQVERWLELLAGDQIDPMLDWLATFHRLETPTCAVAVHDAGGSGKGMLAAGLARVFSQTLAPTPFADAFDNFNAQIIEMPVLLADESVHVPYSSGLDAADALKKAIGDRTHRVQQKNQAKTTLYGALRVVIATNNAGMLATKRTPSAGDLEALNKRVLYIRPTNDARAYLESLGGYDGTDPWIAGDGFARHLAWLRETRTVSPSQSGRFLVDGRGGFADVFASNGKDTRAVLDTVLAMALHGQLDVGRAQPLAAVQVREGAVWVNKNGLAALWSAWSTHDVPGDVVEAVKRITVDGVAKKFKNAGGTSFLQVRADFLAARAADQDQADELSTVLAASR